MLPINSILVSWLSNPQIWQRPYARASPHSFALLSADKSAVNKAAEPAFSFADPCSFFAAVIASAKLKNLEEKLVSCGRISTFVISNDGQTVRLSMSDVFFCNLLVCARSSISLTYRLIVR